MQHRKDSNVHLEIPTQSIPPHAGPRLRERRRPVAGFPSGYATELVPTVNSDGGHELPSAAEQACPEGLG